MPSARCAGGSVAKVTVVSGTNRKPSPAPWMKPVTAMVHCETFWFQPVMSYIAQAVSSEPDHQQDPRIDLADQAADHEHAGHRADSARTHHQTRGHHGIAHQRLQIGRQQRHRRQIGDADDEDEQHPDGEIAVQEQSRIHEWNSRP